MFDTDDWFGRLADVSPSPVDTVELQARPVGDSSHEVFRGLCQPSNLGLSYLVAADSAFYRDGETARKRTAQNKLVHTRIKEGYAVGKTLNSDAVSGFDSWRKLDIARPFFENHRKRYPQVFTSQSQRPNEVDGFIHQVPLRLSAHRLRSFASQGLPDPRLGTLYFLGRTKPDLPHIDNVPAAAQVLADALITERLYLVVGKQSVESLSKWRQSAFFTRPSRHGELEESGVFGRELNQDERRPLFSLVCAVAARIWINADYLWPAQYTEIVRPRNEDSEPRVDVREDRISPLHVAASLAWEGTLRHDNETRKRIVAAMLDSFFFKADSESSILTRLALRFLDLACLGDTLGEDAENVTAFAHLRELLRPDGSTKGKGCHHVRHCGKRAKREPGNQDRPEPWAINDERPQVLALICRSTKEHLVRRLPDEDEQVFT